MILNIQLKSSSRIYHLKIISDVALTPDPPGKLDIFRHQSYSSSMDSAHIRILEHPSHESLCRFLKAEQSLTLEAHVVVVCFRKVANKPLER